MLRKITDSIYYINATESPLSADVGIPAKNDKIREEDLDILAADAFADACCPGNPRDTNVEDLKELYRKIM